MNVVKIKGGLGNQMFQYAFAIACQHNNKKPIALDLTWFNHNSKERPFQLNDFNIDIPFYRRITKNWILKPLKKISLRSIGEEDFQFNHKYLNKSHDSHFDGYWQSPKYFEHIDSIIKLNFTLKKPSSTFKNLLREIEHSNSVALHFRRGDYVTNQNANSHHGTCNIEYYSTAIHTYFSDPKYIFYVFSDDIDWVKENFKTSRELKFISSKLTDAEEIVLMSSCKHNIIANSTFSWWAGWLNKNSNKKVIAPIKWFNDPSINTEDLIPSNWIRV